MAEHKIRHIRITSLHNTLKVPDIFPAVIHAFQRRGLRAAVWTADDRKMVSWALAMGVDFIESDYLWGLDV